MHNYNILIYNGLFKIFFYDFLYQPVIGLIFLKSVLSFDPDFVPNQIRTNYLTAKNNDLLIEVKLLAVLYVLVSWSITAKWPIFPGHNFILQ